MGGPLRRQLYPKAQRAPPHRPAREGQPGDLARQGRDSPRRSSTAHTSARRPPRADAARSGAFQARPARSSRACTNSRPSALAWATSSFSVGERSKASMISAAKTEERRSTSMAGTRARGAAPAGRQRSVKPGWPSGKRVPRGGREAGRGTGSGVRPDRARAPGRSARRGRAGRGSGERPRPAAGNRSFLCHKSLKTRSHILLDSGSNHKDPRGCRGQEGPRQMAICSGAAVPALEDECAGGGHRPTCSQLATARTLARPHTPRLAVLGVYPRSGRSHGAAGRGGTPRSPCSPLPPHVAGTGAREELWLQDLFVAVSAGRDPSIQTRENARLPWRPPRPLLSPVGARNARGLARSCSSRGEVGGEGCEGRTARLSARGRRGLGLRLLRERQPPGRSQAAASPPSPHLRRPERIPGMCSGRAAGLELSPMSP